MKTQTLGNQHYLTRAQYNALKTAGTLVLGDSYYITDENYQLEITSTNKLPYNLISGTPDLTSYITKDVNNLTYYTLTTDLNTALAGKEPADSTILKEADVVDNVTSTSTVDPLSANQGKLLNDRIDNLEATSHFLALWNATTGLPVTNPGTLPYTYKTGDYYRISVTGNLIPSGSSYDGTASATTTAATLATGDKYFYDGSTWSLEKSIETDVVSDVQINSTSIVSSGVATIPIATSSALGVVKIDNANNVDITSSSTLAVVPATSAQIEAKTSSTAPVGVNLIDKAIMEGLGNNSLTWTTAYKTSARNTIGAAAPMTIEILEDTD